MFVLLREGCGKAGPDVVALAAEEGCGGNDVEGGCFVDPDDRARLGSDLGVAFRTVEGVAKGDESTVD